MNRSAQPAERVFRVRLPTIPLATFEVWKRRTERRLVRIERALAARPTVRDLPARLDSSAIDAWAKALVAGLKAARPHG